MPGLAAPGPPMQSRQARAVVFDHRPHLVISQGEGHFRLLLARMGAGVAQCLADHVQQVGLHLARGQPGWSFLGQVKLCLKAEILEHVPAILLQHAKEILACRHRRFFL